MNLNDIASKNEFKEEHGDKYRKQKKKKGHKNPVQPVQNISRILRALEGKLHAIGKTLLHKHVALKSTKIR